MPETTDSLLPANKLDRERLYAVINNMTDGVLALDSSLKVVMGNGLALDILDVNSVASKKIDDLLKLSDKTGREVLISSEIKSHQIGSERQVFSSRDWRLKYSDGTFLHLYVSVAPVRHGFGKGEDGGYVVILRDITDEKSLEEERSEFISVASHELRTPVAVAEGHISNTLLVADKEQVPENIKAALKSAHEQILFLSNLLNDLSTLSRAEQGKLAATHEEFDADELIDSLLQDFRPQALAKSLTFEYLGEKNLGQISNSRLYTREILQNFITNAIKYTERGGITLSAKRNSGGLELAVTDTGIGVGRNEQSNLGQKFFRSSDYRVKSVNGTGLGLYVASKLAKLVGGKVSFESEINHGSTFKIWVPNSDGQAAPKNTGKALGE